MVDDGATSTRTDTVKSESPDDESLRRLAAARGLERAYALFPATVAAAIVRAGQCMTTMPATVSPTAEPAIIFDPGAFDPAAFTVPE
jgi:hypothetical protein